MKRKPPTGPDSDNDTFHAADAFMEIFGLVRAKDPDLAAYVALRVPKSRASCGFCHGRKCKGECK